MLAVLRLWSTLTMRGRRPRSAVGVSYYVNGARFHCVHCTGSGDHQASSSRGFQVQASKPSQAKPSCRSMKLISEVTDEWTIDRSNRLHERHHITKRATLIGIFTIRAPTYTRITVAVCACIKFQWIVGQIVQNRKWRQNVKGQWGRKCGNRFCGAHLCRKCIDLSHFSSIFSVSFCTFLSCTTQ